MDSLSGEPMRALLTLDELIAALIELRTRCPEQGRRPVHLMNMADDGDGLVTDVDLDSFDEEQGTVTSLLSSPRDMPQDPGRSTTRHHPPV